MNIIKIVTFYSIICGAQTQERRLSTNLQLNLGENFINVLQNESRDDDEFFESFGKAVTTISHPEVTEPRVTKYPILIPKIDVEDIDDDIASLDDYQATEGKPDIPLKAEGISTSKYFKRTCGFKEKCKSDETVGESSKRPEKIDFMREPFYCRCDEGVCDQYGDCCYTVANMTNLHYNNPWRCQRVQHEMIWALMISKCSQPDDPNVIPCESPDLISEKRHTYLHDLPVYNNVTKYMYRNIYCAQCNGVPPREIYNMKLQIMCTSNFTTAPERELFISRAQYQAGKRKWTDGKTTCEIFSPELDQYRVSLVFPEIRFCRRDAIESCPPDFALKEPVVNALCSSYTQYVDSRYDVVFKNPHCAECHGVGGTRDLKCLHDLVSISSFDGKISPSIAGTNLGSTGLSIVFDFDIDMEEGYVGYEMKCTGLRIWDFLRQKCIAIECQKNHVLDESDGSCHLLGPAEDHVQASDNHSNSNANATLPSNSCSYIIFIHQDEYILLENNSILINWTGPSDEVKAGKTLIFKPGEYDFWNATTLSICANLAAGFVERFSPVLNYMSLTALGISVFFSTLHALIFLLLPKMRNLPGKNLFCLTLSLFSSQLVFLTLIQNRNRIICLGASITMHFFFLASFFWMNIMSFDIWRTFSTEFMTSRQSSNSNRTFFKYSMFAWLIPASIVCLACLVEFQLADEFGDAWPIFRRIRPLYGHNGLCWITQGLSLFMFFALPAVILICVNIVLFTLTAKAIMDQSQDMFFRSQAEPKKQTQGQGQLDGKFCNGGRSGEEVDRMKLYVKLGLIMGVTWILGFLCGMSGWDWLWYPFVILNGLQGTFIFFAFDCKVKVWQMLKGRLDRDSKCMGGLKAGMSRRDTSTFASNSQSQIGCITTSTKLDV